MKLAVVALGGNAFIGEGERGSYSEQMSRVAEIARALPQMFDLGYMLVLTHGNGPQVGSLLIQQESAAHSVPAMPLDACVAMTQGQLGYLLQQVLNNMLAERGIKKSVVTVITRVVVARNDPAFRHPTKFIGPPFDRATAQRLARERGWKMRLDAGRGYRRVVPSPKPIDVVEKIEIGQMLKRDSIVIAAGGGGIPVLRRRDGRLCGVEAVVDKDLAAEKLATVLGAELLVILTAVDHVSLDFGTKRERPIRRMAAREAERYLADGQFPPGSMGPKIEAAINFLKDGNKRVIITSHRMLGPALAGRAGTEILP